jgi:hypothetical protein
MNELRLQSQNNDILSLTYKEYITSFSDPFSFALQIATTHFKIGESSSRYVVQFSHVALKEFSRHIDALLRSHKGTADLSTDDGHFQMLIRPFGKRGYLRVTICLSYTIPIDTQEHETIANLFKGELVIEPASIQYWVATIGQLLIEQPEI